VAAKVPLEIRLTLRAGSVYYFVDRSLTSPEPHYFVVANSKPLEQELVLLGVITSNVAWIKRLRRNLPGTTIEIDPKKYDELAVVSIVDCNDVKLRTLAELVEKIQRKEVRHHKDVPKDVLAAIQAGIKASPIVDDDKKKLID
jgi:hypothetical protein